MPAIRGVGSCADPRAVRGCADVRGVAACGGCPLGECSVPIITVPGGDPVLCQPENISIAVRNTPTGRWEQEWSCDAETTINVRTEIDLPETIVIPVSALQTRCHNDVHCVTVFVIETSARFSRQVRLNGQLVAGGEVNATRAVIAFRFALHICFVTIAYYDGLDLPLPPSDPLPGCDQWEDDFRCDGDPCLGRVFAYDFWFSLGEYDEGGLVAFDCDHLRGEHASVVGWPGLSLPGCANGFPFDETVIEDTGPQWTAVNIHVGGGEDCAQADLPDVPDNACCFYLASYGGLTATICLGCDPEPALPVGKTMRLHNHCEDEAVPFEILVGRPWADVQPRAGTIAAGGYVDLDVSITEDACDVSEPGVYHAGWAISRTDKPWCAFGIPITLRVSSAVDACLGCCLQIKRIVLSAGNQLQVCERCCYDPPVFNHRTRVAGLLSLNFVELTRDGQSCLWLGPTAPWYRTTVRYYPDPECGGEPYATDEVDTSGNWHILVFQEDGQIVFLLYVVVADTIQHVAERRFDDCNELLEFAVGTNEYEFSLSQLCDPCGCAASDPCSLSWQSIGHWVTLRVTLEPAA